MPGKNSSDWGDQVEDMFKAWSTAQKKMWENWYDMAQAAPKPPPFYGNLADQWRNLAGQGFAAWTAGADPTARKVAERMFAGQEMFTRFLEFSTKAWQAMLARVSSGESWPEVLKSYLEQLRTQFTRAPLEMAEATRSSGDLWQRYLAELNKFTQPWLQSAPQAFGYWGQAAAGRSAPLVELSNLYWDTYQRTIGRLIQSPGVGYSQELERKILDGFETWQALNRATYEYQVVLADVWLQAFEKLAQEMAGLAAKGEAIRSVEQMNQLWTDVADSVFVQAFYSDRYIRSQGQLVNTAMAYRIRQREVVELFLKMADIPTRTEVDEAHRQIYEQRKEMKALKKSLADVAEASPPDSPTRADLDDAHRVIAELRQEMQSLRDELARVATQAVQPGPEPAKPAKTEKAASRPARRAKAKPSSQEGG
jgi:class III poly(R)-hydroxyalkanoic acid synthase PhaE subunit